MLRNTTRIAARNTPASVTMRNDPTVTPGLHRCAAPNKRLVDRDRPPVAEAVAKHGEQIARARAASSREPRDEQQQRERRSSTERGAGRTRHDAQPPERQQESAREPDCRAAETPSLDDRARPRGATGQSDVCPRANVDRAQHDRRRSERGDQLQHAVHLELCRGRRLPKREHETHQAVDRDLQHDEQQHERDRPRERPRNRPSGGASLPLGAQESGPRRRALSAAATSAFRRSAPMNGSTPMSAAVARLPVMTSSCASPPT